MAGRVQNANIELNGDVLLICGEGENQRRMRVDSAILKRSSSVFKAMLSPRFREGTQLATERRAAIALPTDNADNMSILCHILHHQNHKIPYDVSLSHLCTLADLIDTYDLTIAMGPTSRCWFSTLHRKPLEKPECEIIFIAAYCLKCSNLFEDIARDLILRNSGSCPLPCTRASDELAMPNAVALAFVDIERQKSEIHRKLGAAMNDVIIFESGVRSEHGGLCTPSCSVAEKRLQYVIDRLALAQLWPTSELDYLTIEYVLRALEDVKLDQAEINDITSENVCGAPPGECVRDDAPAIDRNRKDMLKASRQVFVDVKGICFQCTRESKVLHPECPHLAEE